jgi:hypothetical protein
MGGWSIVALLPLQPLVVESTSVGVLRRQLEPMTLYEPGTITITLQISFQHDMNHATVYP